MCGLGRDRRLHQAEGESISDLSTLLALALTDRCAPSVEKGSNG